MKSDIERLIKIKKYCVQLANFTDNIQFKNFVTDEKTNYACVFALTQIGELANKLSDALKENSIVPWHAIIAVRNRIVHGYDGLNMKVIWDAIDQEVPLLITQIDEILTGLADKEVKK